MSVRSSSVPVAVWFSSVLFGSVRFGSVRFVSVRSGSVRRQLSSVWFGLISFSSVRFVSTEVPFGLLRKIEIKTDEAKQKNKNKKNPV